MAMSKGDLVVAVAKSCGCTKKCAGDALEAVLGAITKELSKGEKVTITGFGTFKVSNRAARVGVNPQNPSEISEAIITVLNNSTLRNELINNGLERAKQFSWKNSAAEHLNVIEHVMKHASLPLEEKHNNYLPMLEENFGIIRLKGINS